MKKGFSLIETLVVIAMFAIIATVVSRSTTSSLLGSRKSDASTKVRENLSQAVSVIERQLRSARSINNAFTPCDGTSRNSIQYIDQDGNSSNFFCNPSNQCTSVTTTYVSSGSASTRLTSPETICITACSFTCTPSGSSLPPTVAISIEGRSKDTAGVEDTSVRLETGVSLRAY